MRCHGQRYNRETLQVRYKGLNIAEVLDLTVTEALEFFGSFPSLTPRLQTLYDVGLGYIRLGQPATTLSGARPNVSSWRASCPGGRPGAHSTCWMSQRLAFTPLTSTS